MSKNVATASLAHFFLPRKGIRIRKVHTAAYTSRTECQTSSLTSPSKLLRHRTSTTPKALTAIGAGVDEHFDIGRRSAGDQGAKCQFVTRKRMQSGFRQWNDEWGAGSHGQNISPTGSTYEHIAPPTESRRQDRQA